MTGFRGRFFVFLVLAWGLIPAAGAWGAPIQWGPDGHYYEAFLVPEGVGWGPAQTWADNAGGYLAVIGSSDENLFALSLVSNPAFWYVDGYGSQIGPWLGGYRIDSSNWGWVNGEAWGFTAWAPGEPNNMGGGENRLHFFYNSGGGGLWNDIGENVQIHGYIVEYDQNPAAVPLPAALWLLGSGLMALAGFKGRKRFFG